MNTSNFLWQPATPSHQAELDALGAACKAVDGFEPVSHFTDGIINAAQNKDDNVCVMADEQLAAAGWVAPTTAENGEQRFELYGRVHPAYRRKGLGTALLNWSETRARAVGEKGVTLALVIPNEAVEAGARSLYEQFGYNQVFAEKMMVRDLSTQLPDYQLPSELSTATWSNTSTHDFFLAYQSAFYDRLGWLDKGEEGWINKNSQDPGFLPKLSRVVYSGETPVAFITCIVYGSMGWIKQIGVAPDQRRSHIASALLALALHGLHDQGYTEAGLHVNVNNSQAQSAFHEAGFKCRLLRARYIKRIPSIQS